METTKKLVILVLACLLMFSFPAMAGDLEPSGTPAPTMKTLDEVEPRIPLSQQTTPGDVSYLYIISESGSYYLTGDRNTDKRGILIDANNVTIDLAGFTLSGTGVAGRYGVLITGQNNVEIRNGSIYNFGYHGIFENDTTRGKNHRIIGVRAIGNGNAGSTWDGIILMGEGHLIKDCTVAASGDDGITVYYGSTVTGNICYGNSDGINVLTGCTIIGNTAKDNANLGISASSYCMVDQNAAYNNGTNMFTGTGCVLGTNCAP